MFKKTEYVTNSHSLIRILVFLSNPTLHDEIISIEMLNTNSFEHKEYYINEPYREVITRLIVTGGKDR